MRRFFLFRGKPEDSWASFTGGSYGIPNRGFYQRKADALRNAQRIASIRGGAVTVWEIVPNVSSRLVVTLEPR